ncbi:arsenosugar biosynthesis-associated peroxidase-like protein [Desulfovibrio inopinatus]|uniref:arsenosugar biosynthesis-associated peroxidase-like protein n=1 Tax=Desulfovibrio inopinatus TaxID=102109 RepID=UPI0003FC3D24|nr:arsenosugar biosynthesis-associated peroxidase-like protein [Desulfovibrio inopinatus]
MKTYFDPQDLQQFGDVTKDAKELGEKFFDYYGSVMGPGALDEREKALIALAIAHALQCPYCIEAYTQKCLEQDCDKEEMTEAVHVAAAMKAGITLVHAMQMRRKADEVSL